MSSIDSWRRGQQRKKRLARTIIVLVLLIAGVLAFAFWPSGSSPDKAKGAPTVVTMHNRAIGTGVTVSGEKVPSNIKATTVKGTLPPLTRTEQASPLIELTPSGKLQAPLTLRFKLKQQADPKDPNFVFATRETAKDPWEYLHATPTKDGDFVEVQVTHFSFGGLLHLSIPTPQIELWNNPRDYLDIKREFKDNLTGGWTAAAEKPTCQNESKARQDSYVIDSESKSTLYWCFGVEDSTRVLKVVNRKHYPLDVSHENLGVVSNGHLTANLGQLARLGTGKNHIILLPGDTAIFSLDLKMNTLARLKTSYSLASGEAVTLNGLQTAVLTANSIAMNSSAPGAKQLTQQETYKVMNYLLQGKDCYNAVASSNQADLYLDCFGVLDPKGLSEVSPKLGTAGLLASFGRDIGSAASWFREIISGNVDSIKGDADYWVLVRRYNPFQDYVGTWADHISQYVKPTLVISDTGIGTLRWDGSVLCAGETDRATASCDKKYMSYLKLARSGKRLLATVSSSDVGNNSGSSDTDWKTGQKLILAIDAGQLFIINEDDSNVEAVMTRS